MKMRYIYSLLCIAGIAIFVAPRAVADVSPTASAVTEQTRNLGEAVEVREGAETTLPSKGMKQFVVGAPNLLEAKASQSGLCLTGKRRGDTVVALWDEQGRKSYLVRVIADKTAPYSTDSDGPKLLPAVDLRVRPGDSQVLSGKHITRASVSAPDVMDIVPASLTEVLVNAKKEGTAVVRVWDDKGLSTYDFTVAQAVLTPEESAAQITQQIASPTISAHVVGDTVVLSGTASTAGAAKKAENVAEAMGKKVIDAIVVDSLSADKLVASLKSALPDQPLTYEVLADQTIMIRGAVPSMDDSHRIKDIVEAWIGTPEQQPSNNNAAPTYLVGQTEVPADASDKTRVQAHPGAPGEVVVGEDYNITRSVFGGRIPNGPRIVAVIDINPALAQQFLVTAQIIEINRDKLKQMGFDWGSFVNGSFVSQPFQVFENSSPIRLNDAGPGFRQPFAVNIKALVDQNAARILSEPRILIADGHPASILVGGELPIPVPQGSAGATTITVEYKPFGIQLTVRPKITPDCKILLTLTPEISSLDYQNAIEISGFTIPALKTRRATTTVHMCDGQSLAIGGLLSSEDIKDIEKIPFVSSIPIIGELFKNKQFTKRETELIILVTPKLIQNGQPVPIPMPHDQ